MEENGINNNDINSKLDKILQKCELLDNQNRQNVKKYECIIDNLNTQIKFLRVEFKEKLMELTNIFGQIMQPISSKDENIIGNSALLMKDKDDDKMNLKNLNEAVKKKFGEKLFDFIGEKKVKKKKCQKTKKKKKTQKIKKKKITKKRKKMKKMNKRMKLWNIKEKIQQNNLKAN